MFTPAKFISIIHFSFVVVSAVPVYQSQKADIPSFFQPLSAAVTPVASFGATPVATIDDAQKMAVTHFSSAMGMREDELQRTSSFTSSTSGIHVVHFAQMYQGLPIVNAVGSANIDSNGSLISSHQSFVPDEIMDQAVPINKRDNPVIPVDVAILKFAAAKAFRTTDKLTVTQNGDKYVVSGASFAVQPIKASQKYYQTADSLVHAWDLSVRMNNIWENAFVNSATGEILGVSAWTSDLRDKKFAPHQRRHVKQERNQLPLQGAIQPLAPRQQPQQQVQQPAGPLGRAQLPQQRKQLDQQPQQPRKPQQQSQQLPHQQGQSGGLSGGARSPKSQQQRPQQQPQMQGKQSGGPQQGVQQLPQQSPQNGAPQGGVQQPPITSPQPPTQAASYLVIPIGQRDPQQLGKLVTINDPKDLKASPEGWHQIGGQVRIKKGSFDSYLNISVQASTSLSGNNGIAQSNPNNVMDPAGLAALTRPTANNLAFTKFQFNAAKGPEDATNANAATVNAFYVVNSMHDVLYNYGFNEAAGNFQQLNYGKGGLEGDGVFINTQDGSGTDNANFFSRNPGRRKWPDAHVLVHDGPTSRQS
ncbi:Fungalysin metallopeptidase-domain-containing protein [Chytriomyces sp. MP71]|nr:Fungalysin metallopeptidase-domain-containing protein [Chytriomyces sp. MP71]